MKVLLVHNYYQQSGGEDAVVAAEKELLEANGHDVVLYSVNNDDIKGIFKKALVAIRINYSADMRSSIANTLRFVKPDVVHVHNFFPLITPSVYDSCSDFSIPVVQTLHNYRLICPGALFIRDDKICEECMFTHPYRSILYRCYHKSILGTYAVARMVSKNNRNKTWQTKVDRFIALTEFAKTKYIASGFPGQKIYVKPNFISIPNTPEKSEKIFGALFVGRLSREKGLHILFEAWKKINYRLSVIGDGPMLDVLTQGLSDNIRLFGHKTKIEVIMAMESCNFLVLPSLCYEGFPLVLAEAFACGLPVIVSRLGSMMEIVEDGITGLHFIPGDIIDLGVKIQWALNHPDEMAQMGRRARVVYEMKYTPERNYRHLIGVYDDVIAEKKGQVYDAHNK